jgi:uncharacterized protein (DUF1697 family)
MTYLALLRGVNVGGNTLVKMADLRAALTAHGFTNVRSYIQSGNVIFTSDEADTAKLAAAVAAVISKSIGLTVDVAIFSQQQWQHIIDAAPGWWGKNQEWKHNLLILIPPCSVTDAVAAIGTLKPDIEAMEPGTGVLYQSMSFALFGRTTAGKLTGNPIYKKITVRNYNTATNLLGLLAQRPPTDKK